MVDRVIQAGRAAGGIGRGLGRASNGEDTVRAQLDRSRIRSRCQARPVESITGAPTEAARGARIIRTPDVPVGPVPLCP
jgi:hypothetical protein